MLTMNGPCRCSNENRKSDAMLIRVKPQKSKELIGTDVALTKYGRALRDAGRQLYLRNEGASVEHPAGIAGLRTCHLASSREPPHSPFSLSK